VAMNNPNVNQPDPRIRLLDQCTVKINGLEGQVGAGFFVTPQFIITCSHVLSQRPLQLEKVFSCILSSGQKINIVEGTE
jgi:hypothetical protein